MIHKQRIGTRLVRVVVTALAIIFCTSVAAPKATAATGPNVFFLGTRDTNKDGTTNASDRSSLFAILQGGAAVQISADQESVVTYAVAPDLSKIAYAINDGDKYSLQIVQTAQPKNAPLHVDLAGQTNVSKLEYFNGIVWVIGSDAQNKPDILGIDAAQGKTVAQRAMHQDDSQIVVDGSGKWMMGYNQKGALGVFALPDLKQEDLGLSGYATYVPLWSPQQERFVWITAPTSAPQSFGLTIVDVAPVKVARMDMPEFPKGTNFNASWSDGGRYLAFTATETDAQGQITKSTLQLADTKQNNSVIFTGPPAAIVAWSPDDAYALVQTRVILPDGSTTTKITLYDADNKKLTPINPPQGVEFISYKWNPGGDVLALVGRSLALGQYGVFIANDPDYSTPKSVVVTNDVELSRAVMHWTPDGKQLVFISGLASKQDQGGNVTPLPGTIFSVDPASGAITRLSPDGVSVLLVDAQVR